MRIIKVVLSLFLSFYFISSFAQDYEQMARQMGISSNQIDSYKNKMTGGNQSKTGNVYEGDDRTRTQPQAVGSQGQNNYANRVKITPEEQRKLRFGMDIFNRNNLSFEPNFNIATPSDYVLAAGDEIIIDVWGASEQTYKLVISPDGTVFIPNIGVVNLSSLTVGQAEQKLLNVLSDIYSGIDGAEVKINLTVGKIRSVKVNVTGEAVNPGTYTMPSVSTLFNVLYMAGGVNDIGSLRDIKLYRNGNLITTLDVYEYITKGKSVSNVRLQDNDMIIVEPYKNLVATQGSLKRERVYELKDGETLSDLLRYAGGFSGDAFTEKVTVSRRNGDRYNINTVFADNFPLFKMRDGDMLEVEKTIPLFDNRVSISGAVWREGNYEITPKTSTLKSLIESAGGLKGDAFTNRGQITRQLPDYSTEIIAVDLKKILTDETPDMALQSNDKVYIPSVYDLKEKQYIKIFGEVNLPKLTEKELKAIAEKEKSDRQIKEQQAIIQRDTDIMSARSNPAYFETAGGGSMRMNELLFEEQNRKNDYLERYDYDVDDSLYVERSGNNTLPFHKGMTVSDAILLAGGMKESASEAKIVVARRMKNNTSLSALNSIANEFEFAISHDLKLDESGANFELEPFDEIYVRKSPGYVEQRRVTIQGEVAFPGDYVLTQTGERLSSVINKAGNFTPDAYIKGTRLVRRKSDSEIERERVKIAMNKDNNESTTIDTIYTVGIDVVSALQNPGTFSDPVLREGDLIIIPEATNTVKISGAVLHPNTVSFRESKKYKYYLNNAGGYVQRARKHPYIIYMNGTVALARKGAKIEPGCEIVVPMKLDSKSPIGIQGWVSMATSLTSVAAMATSIIK